ncbi:MAG: hypothetical protein O3B65_03280 [Chloroflexi bacterium]|nr:hypothetical protein [Chloroflexota bacterium]
MSTEKNPPFRDAANTIAETMDADVLFINAPSGRSHRAGSRAARPYTPAGLH